VEHSRQSRQIASVDGDPGETSAPPGGVLDGSRGEGVAEAEGVDLRHAGLTGQLPEEPPDRPLSGPAYNELNREHCGVKHISRLLRDFRHLHIGQYGLHRWQNWRDRSWCKYCWKETSRGR
jgi:hypothetical protein